MGSSAFFIWKNIERLEFHEIDGRDKASFTMSRAQYSMLCLYGFLANMVWRDFIGYSVPFLLMSQNDPLHCVLRSLSTTFLVKMDDCKPVTYTVKLRYQDVEAARLLQ